MKKNTLFVFCIIFYTCAFAQEKDKFENPKDGKTYQTVTIGTQTWFAENYNYNTSTGSKCFYDDNDYCKKYGRLYVCKTAHESKPEGWRLPEVADIEALALFYGGVVEPLFFEYDEGILTHGGWEIKGVFEKIVSDLELKPGGLINFEYEVDVNSIGYYWLHNQSEKENIMHLLIVDFIEKTITISIIDWTFLENDFMLASIRYIKNM
jgi:uncharacterized protein (TIGR02145 family)